ncbi:MAG: 5-carboxymethyl-2-hydroxymuconate Delta-isomerase [Brucellaceae bacterium]|nr:5-carboxymethyl-2-hydroxymuconate Delta-isomerase [Brucellaceae bacterium]
MPHFIFEYSSNLDSRLDIKALCEVTRHAALETGIFEIGAIRVRTHRSEIYSIADGDPKNAFVHLMLRVGIGRDVETRKAAGDRIFAAVSEFCAELLAEPYFALSFEICEIDPVTTWKKNSIHPRLRGTA